MDSLTASHGVGTEFDALGRRRQKLTLSLVAARLRDQVVR